MDLRLDGSDKNLPWVKHIMKMQLSVQISVLRMQVNSVRIMYINQDSNHDVVSLIILLSQNFGEKGLQFCNVCHQLY